MSERPKVTSWRQTCMSCPSQWEGELADGRIFYGRYRWSCLSLGIGASLSEAVRSTVMEQETGRGDGWDGDMPTAEFMQRTAEYLDWGVSVRPSLR